MTGKLTLTTGGQIKLGDTVTDMTWEIQGSTLTARDLDGKAIATAQTQGDLISKLEDMTATAIHDRNAADLSRYGCTKDAIDQEVRRWREQGHMGGSPHMLAFSILSDAQSLIELDQKEHARLTLNRAKYILQTYGKSDRFLPGERVQIWMSASNWADAILLHFNEGTTIYYPLNGEPYTERPSWQVRIDDPRQPMHEWLVTVDPDRIRKKPA